MIKLFQTSSKWEQWWAKRQIDWTKEYLSTWNHPHRTLISAALSRFNWMSLIEVGCGAGANLANILQHFKGKQLGGIDVSPDAIAVAEKAFVGAIFKVGPVHDIMISDDSTDVVLSDMCLIYYGPRKIGGALKEIRRIARNRVIFCEFHHTSFWKRLKLRLTSGYYAYDYRKLLDKHGFHDIDIYKIPEAYWPGGNPQKTFGYIITAKVPRRK